MRLLLVIAGVLCFCGICRAQTELDSLDIKPDSLTVKTDSLPYTPYYRQGLKYVVKTNTGTVFIGFIIRETSDFISLENRSIPETYEIRRSTIVSVSVFSNKSAFAEVTGENYHAGNYLFANSAFTFTKGQLRSSYHWLVFENLDYAFTDNWALTMSTIAFYPVSLGIKFAYPLDGMNYVGGGVFAMGNLTVQSGSPFWGYGVTGRFTHGIRNQNFTIGGGMLGLNSDLVYTSPVAPFYNVPYANLGYCSLVNQRIALNLEGWYMPTIETALAGVGIKLVKNQGSCWSFGCYGLLNNFNSNAVKLDIRALPIPYLGLSQNF